MVGMASEHEQNPLAQACMVLIPTETVKSCVKGTLSTCTLQPENKTLRTVLEQDLGEENTGTRP